ncbi:acyl-CoA desaturase [Actinocatenispora sera]|uniref:Delta fatty acid desaturase n=1 Tax=Actinocatenispora sera TaxID=390989 RepID=A0A810L530_9ACTN|nr:acyl-CoA desaturase [Actinocatenispora sera]BCJ30337.1 delta fatty acid desaturase [Actinocatenispora sera]
MSVPTVVRRGTGSDYAELSRRIAAAGLLRRRPVYQVFALGSTAALYVGAWLLFALVGDSWWQLGTAALLAVAFTQVGFVGHEVAHRQVVSSRRSAERIGLVAGNLLIGLGHGWWADKHNRHHAHPNQVGADPDVAAGVVRWTEEQAEDTSGVQRFVTRWQGILFLPMLTLEGLNLHVAGFRSAFGRKVRHPVLEGVVLGLHVVGYVAVAFTVLSPGKAIAFMALHQALFGVYMGLSFAPNHKGMPVLGPDVQLDFLRRQVLTSRNVRGGPVTDWMLGGLNYQIEHHLFPSMPRPALRRAQPIVAAYCAELGVDYEQESLPRSYARALQALHEVGEPLRS